MSKILIGLDIGTHSIKAVQIARNKASNILMAAGFISTPINTLNVNNSNDEKILGDSINRLVNDMKISTVEVSASLPSSRVITHIIEVPLMSEKELSSSIQWEAEQYIPWQLSNVKIDYVIIDQNLDTKKMKVLIVAAPIKLIEQYMRIMTLAGLTPVAIETEILATARAIGRCLPTLTNVLIVNIGGNGSEIALMRDHILIFTKSLPIGGTIFTKAISEELGFEHVQAEEYKKTYGLDSDKLEGKIAKIINPFIINLFEEIEKTIAYFKEQYQNEKVSTAVLTGGSTKLPGLVLATTKNLGLDSQICNPFSCLSVDPKILPIITPDSPIYTTAVGLGLKEI
ncbi:hypothetical protein A2960_02185 [Candidatus Gottesmanbacteria bacterium RIFCSPLOWO2_01_FULL_39_12b]|uniref:SHS2 domain-containing protein n=1 Tax=Candidatus Gottesmanbacteria bacterium RIFCSPLOWO2_01_FULL_39_12b TaxID=1798388 RepID=A0A1F6AQZ5_9BACT|nr:MAG: hypothetical protein A2960_02185 [Candidatus Gottesmanbacteria bacterium RIFCSPLOWO2_01_FULL_39_12b]